MDLPPGPVLNDPATPSMERIFLPFRHEWVWDFFFKSDHQQADMLQYAVSDRLVTLIEFSFVTNSATDPYASRFGVSEKHRMLLLPSFSTGAISVGFGVNEAIASSSTLTCRERYTGRIVRDDEAATSLFLAEDKNLNLVEVHWFNLYSPTQRESVYCVFHRKPFLDALKTIRSNYDDAAMKSALCYYCSSMEGRPCEKCAHLPACACKLAIVPKRHPLDSETELANLVSYVGNYNGISTLGLYEKGNNVFLANYNGACSVNIMSDSISQQKLALWAMCAAVQQVEINPVRSLMSKVELMQKGESSPVDTFLLKSVAESLENEANDETNADSATSVSKVVTQMLKNTVADLWNKQAGVTIGVGSAMMRAATVAKQANLDIFPDMPSLPSISSMDIPALLPSLSMDILPPSDSFPMLPDLLKTPDPLATAASISANRPAAAAAAVVNHLPMKDVEMEDSTDAIVAAVCPDAVVDASAVANACGRVAKRARQMRSNTPSSDTKVTTCADAASECGSNSNSGFVATSQPLVALAPASKGSAKDSDTGSEMSERRRKIELRKARNRESAHRSNLRRKMQIQKLKDEIDEANRREVYLRAREKMLREENMTLRTTVFR